MEFCVEVVASFIAGHLLYKMQQQQQQQQEDDYQFNFHGFHYARGKTKRLDVKRLGKFTPVQIASSAALIGAAVLAAASALRFSRGPPPPPTGDDAPADVQLELTRVWVIEEYLNLGGGGGGDGNGV